MAEFWRWPESQGSASEQVGGIVAIDRLIVALGAGLIQPDPNVWREGF